MGCCHSENTSVNLGNHAEKIKEAIDSGSTSRLRMLFEYYHKKDPNPEVAYIDKTIVSMSGIELNSMSYSLFLGKTSMFKFLYESGGSIKKMEEQLVSQKMKGINLICFKGYKELLEFYLPIYLKDYISVPQSVRSYTIDLKDKEPKPEFDLAIHSACRAGMVNIVAYIYKFFKDKQNCPKEFDIHATDEFNGEDCALIACRVGCFALVKFLYENCSVSFKNLNFHKENAIMVCVSGWNKLPSFGYLESIEFLINTVGVDVCYNYEELLCMADGSEMIALLEGELEKKGIMAKKKDLDLPVLRVNRVCDTFDSSERQVFNDETFKLVQPDNPSLISSISDNERTYGRKSDFMSSKLESE
jgi:hypothetical protein